MFVEYVRFNFNLILFCLLTYPFCKFNLGFEFSNNDILIPVIVRNIELAFSPVNFSIIDVPDSLFLAHFNPGCVIAAPGQVKSLKPALVNKMGFPENELLSPARPAVSHDVQLRAQASLHFK